MSINGLDSEVIKMQASSLLQSKQKVDLGREDLKLLWENLKLTNDASLFENVSDEDALAMFDKLDNSGNSAATSYKLLMNWLKSFNKQASSVPPVNVTPAAPTTPEVTEAPPVQEEPPVSEEPPVVDAPPAQEDPSVTEAPPLFDVPPVQEAPPVAEEPPVVDAPPATENPTVAEEPLVVGALPATENPTVADNPSNVEINPSLNIDRQALPPLRKGKSTTLEINGNKYIIKNESNSSNNIFYSVQNGKVVIEAHYITITPAEDNQDADDNIAVIGNNNTIDMRGGNDKISVEGDYNMIYGGAGDDFIQVKGFQNSIDMSSGDDVIWINGENNNAIGQGGDDNFFAYGADNVLAGKRSDEVIGDGAFYLDTLGGGQQFSIERNLTMDDAKDFINWLNGEESGPPYSDVPVTLDGHRVLAYDDDTYTDEYENEPYLCTEFRDIAYRKISAKTEENQISTSGEGIVTFYNENEEETSKITVTLNGPVTILENGVLSTIPKDKVKFVDQDGNVVTNPGSMSDIIRGLATGKLRVLHA